MALTAACLAATGCGPDETDETDEQPISCGEQPAPANACSFDGECADYFVCIAQACAVPEAMTGEMPAGQVTVNGRQFSYELAEGELARSRGLAGRPCMAEGWGLMLEWPDDADRQITMEGMLFDLDMVFLNDGNEVVDIIRGAPVGSKVLYGGGPARRVLEVEAGSIP